MTETLNPLPPGTRPAAGIGTFKMPIAVGTAGQVLKLADVAARQLEWGGAGLENAEDITDGVKVTDDAGTGLGTLEVGTVEADKVDMQIANAKITVPSGSMQFQVAGLTMLQPKSDRVSVRGSIPLQFAEANGTDLGCVWPLTDGSGVKITESDRTTLGTLQAATVDNTAAALELGNATYGVTVPGDATFSGEILTPEKIRDLTYSGNHLDLNYVPGHVMLSANSGLWQKVAAQNINVSTAATSTFYVPVTLDSTLDVTGDATFSGDVDISGSLIVGDPLTPTYNVEFYQVTGNNYVRSVSGNATGGFLVHSGAASGRNYAMQSDSSGDFSIHDYSAGGGQRFSINSAGNATFSGAVDINGAGGLDVTGGPATFSGKVKIEDASYFEGGTNGFRFNSNGDLNNNVIMYDTGNTWCREGLKVGGAGGGPVGGPDALEVVGNLNVGSTATFTGLVEWNTSGLEQRLNAGAWESYETSLTAWQTGLKQEASASGMKMAAFGGTPVLQPAAIADATDAASAITQLNALLGAMRDLNWIAT